MLYLLIRFSIINIKYFSVSPFSEEAKSRDRHNKLRLNSGRIASIFLFRGFGSNLNRTHDANAGSIFNGLRRLTLLYNRDNLMPRAL